MEAASDSGSSHQAVEQLLRPGIVHRLDKGTTGASKDISPDVVPHKCCWIWYERVAEATTLLLLHTATCKGAEAGAEAGLKLPYNLLCSRARVCGKLKPW